MALTRLHLSVRLTATLLVGLAALAASPSAVAYDFKAGGLAYNINPDGESVTLTYERQSSPRYSNASGSLVIPSSVQYSGKTYTVSAVGEYAFYGCSGFTGTLAIPNSVTSIGTSAFSNCSGITDISIPMDLADIGSSCFYGTGWYKAQPNGIVYIGNVAYGYKGTVTNGATLTLRDGIKGIAGGAFSYCSGFTGSLSIPKTVTTIGENAFYNCKGFKGALTIPNSVTTIGNYAFNGCSGFTGSLTIGNLVTSIGNYAFYRCSGFTGALNIPNSVSTIGESAFSDCSGFTGTFVIPNSVTSIGMSAFQYCSGFTGSLTIPSTVTNLGSQAFQGCSGFTGFLNIIDPLPKFGYGVFEGCTGLDAVNITNLAAWCKSNFRRDCFSEDVSQRLFLNGVEVNNLIIPSSIDTIYSAAFRGFDNINSLTIPNSVRYIDHSTFSYGIKDVYFADETDCNLYCEFLFGYGGEGARIHLGNNIKRLSFDYDSFCGNDTLFIADLTSYCNHVSFSENVGLPTASRGTIFLNGEELNGHLDIPNDVVRLNYGAFYNAQKLTSVTIPNSISYMGSYAFSRTGLRDVYSNIEHPERVDYGINGAVYDSWYGPFAEMEIDTCTLHVPAGTEELYRITWPWTGFFNIIEDATTVVRGDVNGDGLVDVRDLNCIVNLILGRANSADFSGRDDVNEDSSTDVRDINEIIKIILSQ